MDESSIKHPACGPEFAPPSNIPDLAVVKEEEALAHHRGRVGGGGGELPEPPDTTTEILRQ